MSEHLYENSINECDAAISVAKVSLASSGYFELSEMGVLPSWATIDIISEYSHTDPIPQFRPEPPPSEEFTDEVINFSFQFSANHWMNQLILTENQKTGASNSTFDCNVYIKEEFIKPLSDWTEEEKNNLVTEYIADVELERVTYKIAEKVFWESAMMGYLSGG